MKHNHKWLALALTGALSLSLLAGCAGSDTSDAPAGDTDTTETQETTSPADSGALVIAEQGIFSAGGTVIESDGTFDVSNYYTSREGSTSHVDHAKYNLPAGFQKEILHGCLASLAAAQGSRRPLRLL